MSNNYSQFSEMIEDITPEEAEWISKVLRLDAEDDMELEQLKKEMALEGDHDLDMWPNFEWALEGEDGTSLCLYSEEGLNEDHLIWFVQALINKFRPDFIFSVTGSSTCSKMRPSEFGGWWLVISKDQIKGGSSWKDANEAVEAIKTATEEVKEEKDPYWKVRGCLDHVDCFEVANYGEGESITVECTKCGVVLFELYNAGLDPIKPAGEEGC